MDWTDYEIRTWADYYTFQYYKPHAILCYDIETVLKIKDTDNFLLELNKRINDSIYYIDCYRKRFRKSKLRNTNKDHLMRVLLKYYISIIDLHNDIHHDNNDNENYDLMIEKYTENEPAEYIENELRKHLDHYIIIL
jgi:hypothetical protein